MSWPTCIGWALLVPMVAWAVWDGLQEEKRERFILEVLASFRGELYGLELVRTSGGLLRRGAVYFTLSGLERRGLVESREEALTPDYIGIPRRLYRITNAGLHELTMRTKARAA
jgi:DNA-binding PadR family transcriptional regulator